jgi:hypothetical protein
MKSDWIQRTTTGRQDSSLINLIIYEQSDRRQRTNTRRQDSSMEYLEFETTNEPRETRFVYDKSDSRRNNEKK